MSINLKTRSLACFILLVLTSATLASSPQTPNLITHQELMRVVTGLFSILVVIIGLAWVVKRLNVVTLSSSKGFQSIATMNLGAKEKIMLLRAGSRYLLIGFGAGAVHVLHDFGEEQPQGFEAGNTQNFADLLRRTMGKKSNE